MILIISADKRVDEYYRKTLTSIAIRKERTHRTMTTSIWDDSIREQVMELLIRDGYTVTKVPNFRTLLTARW